MTSELNRLALMNVNVDRMKENGDILEATTGCDGKGIVRCVKNHQEFSVVYTQPTDLCSCDQLFEDEFSR